MKKEKKDNLKYKNDDTDNKENLSDEINFFNILKMSINEKKSIDKIEREQKKMNKMQLIKIQQRNRLFFNNQKMELN